MKTTLLLLALICSTSSHAQSDTQSKIALLVAKGDSLTITKDYTLALQFYKEACRMDSIQCPKEKLAFVQEQMQPTYVCGNPSREYQKIITAADNYFKAEDYVKARGYYERATLIRPNDEYPKKQMVVIDELLLED